MSMADLEKEELIAHLDKELRSAADKLSDLARLLYRSWTDPAAAPIRDEILRSITALEEISRTLGSGRPYLSEEISHDPEWSFPEKETEAAECCWDGNGMRVFRDGLSESKEKIRRIMADFKEAQERTVSLNESINGQILLKVLQDTVKTESAVIEIIPVLDRIYSANENAIADYFDLTVQKVPPTKLGTSTFEQLGRHEEQMPFEKPK